MTHIADRTETNANPVSMIIGIAGLRRRVSEPSRRTPTVNVAAINPTKSVRKISNRHPARSPKDPRNNGGNTGPWCGSSRLTHDAVAQGIHS